mgnify:CR=1 FL=1
MVNDFVSKECYMLHEILKEVGLGKNEVQISEEMIRFLIETYTNEAGVRKIKEKIQKIKKNQIYSLILIDCLEYTDYLSQF